MSISRRSFIARGLGYSSLLLPFSSSLLSAQAGGRPGEESFSGNSTTKGQKESAQKIFQSILEKELKPSSLEYRVDGRYEMLYDFNPKRSWHSKIFTRKIGERNNDKFRWTLPEEECLRYRVPGLRIADKGMALLRVWWEDDVEVEAKFRQHVTMSPRNVFAIVFNNKSNAAVGSNYGSQCALFSRGRMVKRTKGKIRNIHYNQYNSIGLNVRSGQFAACRDGVVSSRGKYPESKFQSGRIGFFWGGAVAGVIESLKITGRIDYERTFEDFARGRK